MEIISFLLIWTSIGFHATLLLYKIRLKHDFNYTPDYFRKKYPAAFYRGMLFGMGIGPFVWGFILYHYWKNKNK